MIRQKYGERFRKRWTIFKIVHLFEILLPMNVEKLIRQGICTMIRRSGVPVEVILECNNGERALEILKEQQGM